MKNVEFLSFIKTPAEKHLGVATIRVDRRFIFRFKINENPKGEGIFSNAPSIKIDESYYPAFAFDSSYESDEVKKFVLSNVKLALHANIQNVNSATSVPSVPFQYAQEPAQSEFSFNPEQAPF